MTKEVRFKDIYTEAVNFVDGNKKITVKDFFEIMYDAKEYTVPEICQVINKLWDDGFLKR